MKLDDIKLTVKFTRDYGIFLCDEEINRDINKANYNGIANSIRQFGFLISNAIFVMKMDDGRYKILDGQHRFSALRSQNMTVPYIILEESAVLALILNEDDEEELVTMGESEIIRSLNYQSKKWAAVDFIHHYAAINEDMKFVEDVMRKTFFSTSLINVILRESGLAEYDLTPANIKSNHFKINHDDEEAMELFNEIVKKIKLFSGEIPQALHKNISEQTFKALSFLSVGVEKFNFEKILQSVSDNPEQLNKVQGFRENLKLLIKIHNAVINPGKKRIFMDDSYKGKDKTKLFS